MIYYFNKQRTRCEARLSAPLHLALRTVDLSPISEPVPHMDMPIASGSGLSHFALAAQIKMGAPSPTRRWDHDEVGVATPTGPLPQLSWFLRESVAVNVVVRLLS